MPPKEAKTRIKINKLQEEAEWRLVNLEKGNTNVVFENDVKITTKELDGLGEGFKRATDGFIDYLLNDEKNFPL